MTEWTLSRDNQNLIYKITFHQGAIFNQIYPGFIKGADQLNSEEVGRGYGQEPMGSGMGDFRKKFIADWFRGKNNPTRKYPAVMAFYVREKILSPKAAKVW